jgi:hypothetical protein
MGGGMKEGRVGYLCKREREREKKGERERERERERRHLTPMKSILIFERPLFYGPVQG